jgi:GGDEF domain-containing protein
VTSRHDNAATSATAEVAIISPHRQDRGGRVFERVSAKHFTSYDALRKSGLAVAALVVRSDDESFNAQTLRSLRRDATHATSLVFVDGPLPDADMPVSDGPVPGNADELSALLEGVRARSSAGAREDDDPDGLLLEFMWLRPRFVLEPHADWHHPRRYRYPLLESMDRSDADPEGWLRRLDQQGLIESAGLKDRQRECDFCGSAHLSFIDRCPSCHSIDITDPQSDGNCRCVQCRAVFPEGEVIARCVICNHEMAPDELRVHRIHAWRLSALGRHAAQGRRAVQQVAAPDESQDSKFATREQFMKQLDWVLKIARQQRNFCFSLFAMRLENAGAMYQVLGRARTSSVLETFAERLREPLADADIATRPEPDLLWFLVPDSDARALRELHKLIQQLTDEIAAQEGVGPCWRTVDLSVTSHDAAAQTTESLLRRLSGALTPEAAAEEILAEAARRPAPPVEPAAADGEAPDDESRAMPKPPPIAAPSRKPQAQLARPKERGERGGRGRRIAPTVD